MVVNKSLLQSLQFNNQNIANGSASINNSQLSLIEKRGITVKPQKFFADKPDNSYLPFLTKLRIKTNQLIPLPGI